MITSSPDVEELFQSDDLYYHTQLNKIAWQIIPDFDRLLKRFVGFHLLAAALLVLEAAALAFFSPFLLRSSLFAVGLSLFVLTFFSAYVLKLHLQARKGEKLEGLRQKYVQICKQLLHYEEGVYKHHLTLANAYCLLETRLQHREDRYYKLPRWLELLAPTVKRFSTWCHFEDVHGMREMLLRGAIEEHIKLVRAEPTNLQMHAALANAYVRLSSLFRISDEEKEQGTLGACFVQELQDKFRTVAKRAIEEFKILNDYAPDEPWVHAQLAYSYRDLDMPEEEIREYETMLTLHPHDGDTLYKLGALYFKRGETAKGLRIYEKLKRLQYTCADRLIEFYGS